MEKLFARGFVIVLATLVLADSAALAATKPAPALRACSNTTKFAYSACLFDNLDALMIANGKCTNERSAADRDTCLDAARAAQRDANASCLEQRDARTDLCDKFGEAPYDPKFEPANFVDPREIGRSVAPNPWVPLIPGRTMIYQSPNEVVRVVITDKIKLIDGVPCLVVRDRVEVDGKLAEETIDWFAQDLAGNVWYCGETTAEFEDGVPVNVSGSFQADVDGARPGLFAKAAPAVGDAYRQEFDLGNAEDVAAIISLNGSATTPAASCYQSCLVTEETTPLDPALLEHKYYKFGVGFILQIKPKTGERLQLVQITSN